MVSVEDMIYMVRLAQELGRPQDMIPLAKQVLQLSRHLDMQQRVILSQAYHESVNRLRQSLSVLQSVADTADTPEKVQALESYVAKLRHELRSICLEIIQTTQEKLLPLATSRTDEIFYYKMQGDYWRYDAEFEVGEQRDHAVINAQSCYETAMAMAEQDLDVTNPIRLGLILNYCVFLVEVKGDIEQGKAIAGAILESAEAKVAEWNTQWQDADICLKLLRDNCDLWREEDEKKDE
jgi:14-3-3 protein epsilon